MDKIGLTPATIFTIFRNFGRNNMDQMDNNLCKMDACVAAALGRVHEARHLHKPPGTGMRRVRTLGLFAVVFVYEGGGFYEDAHGTRATVEAGDLIVVFPDLPHRYGTDARRSWREFYLTFDGPVFAAWREAGLLDPARPIWSLRPVTTWRRRWESVVDPALGAPWQRVAHLQRVLADALAAQPGGAREGVDDWMARARAMLASDLDRPVSMPDVARRLGVSYDHFRKRFTRAAGETPGQHRARRVTAHAQALMRTSTMTDQQIAAALGFCDPFYFSRRFTQLTGRTPSAYRRALALAAATEAT